MTHRVEIQIDDDVMWAALGRFSSVTGKSVSTIIQMVFDATGKKYLKPIIAESVKNEEAANYPEIKAFIGA